MYIDGDVAGISLSLLFLYIRLQTRSSSATVLPQEGTAKLRRSKSFLL